MPERQTVCHEPEKQVALWVSAETIFYRCVFLNLMIISVLDVSYQWQDPASNLGQLALSSTNLQPSLTVLQQQNLAF